MCGIIGVINKEAKYKRELDAIFFDLFFVNQLRGTDGAGAFWFDHRDDQYRVRKNSDFSEVWNDKEFDKAVRHLDFIPFMLAHNRAATRGSVKTANNHPFDEGNVVLVHNGTMTYVPEKFSKGTDVDSHAIAKWINEDNIENFIKDSFGAYALAWFNKMDRTINLLRNKDRPLGVVYFEDFALIASEIEMAKWVALRHGYKPVSEQPIPEHTLFTFSQFKLTPTITDLSKAARFSGYGKYPTVISQLYGEEDDEGESVVQLIERMNGKNRPQRTLKPIATVEEQKSAFNLIDPLAYFRSYHRIATPSNSTTFTSIKDATVDLRKGARLKFSLDQTKLHNKFVEISGNIPNVPIISYEVRGHMAKEKFFEDQTKHENYMEGTITSIKEQNNKINVWVSQVCWTEELDPQYQKDADEKKLCG